MYIYSETLNKRGGPFLLRYLVGPLVIRGVPPYPGGLLEIQETIKKHWGNQWFSKKIDEKS